MDGESDGRRRIVWLDRLHLRDQNSHQCMGAPLEHFVLDNQFGGALVRQYQFDWNGLLDYVGSAHNGKREEETVSSARSPGIIVAHDNTSLPGQPLERKKKKKKEK